MRYEVVNNERIPLPEPTRTPEELEAYLAEQRDVAIAGGMLFDGHPIPTDDKAFARIVGAALAATRDPATVKRWQTSNSPVTFVTFDAPHLIALGEALDACTQGVFDVVDALGPQLRDGTVTSFAEIDTALAAVPRVFTSGL